MLRLGHQCQRNRSPILLRALGGAESAKACQGRKDHGFPAAYAWKGQRQEDPWIYSGPYKHLPYVSGKTLAPRPYHPFSHGKLHMHAGQIAYQFNKTACTESRTTIEYVMRLLETLITRTICFARPRHTLMFMSCQSTTTTTGATGGLDFGIKRKALWPGLIV